MTHVARRLNGSMADKRACGPKLNCTSVSTLLSGNLYIQYGKLGSLKLVALYHRRPKDA